jgi:hypothetical protein
VKQRLMTTVGVAVLVALGISTASAATLGDITPPTIGVIRIDAPPTTDVAPDSVGTPTPTTGPIEEEVQR